MQCWLPFLGFSDRAELAMRGKAYAGNRAVAAARRNGRIHCRYKAVAPHTTGSLSLWISDRIRSITNFLSFGPLACLAERFR